MLEDGQGAEGDVEAFFVDHAADGQQEQGVIWDAQAGAKLGSAGGVGAQGVGIDAVDDQVEAGGVRAELLHCDIAQRVAVGGDQAGLIEREAGHGAEQRVLSGHQRIGAGDGDDQRDAEQPAGDRAEEAVGQ